VTTNFVGFIGFYQQSWVCVAFGRWRRTTRSAIAALGQLTDQLTATSGRWGIAGRATDRLCLASSEPLKFF